MSSTTTVNKINPVVFFVSREQVFTFNLSGLLPLSQHYMYFERQAVSSTKIKPLGGSLGDPIKTDADGKVTFDYYYSSDLPAERTPIERVQRMTELVAGNKEVVVTTINQSSLPSNYKDTALSVYTTSIVLNTYIPPSNEFAEIVQEETIINKYVAPVPPPATYDWDWGGTGAGESN